MIWLTIFGIGMGFFEAIVVVYLRFLYYPEGFCFPLVLLPAEMLGIELVREISTLVMLISVGVIAGKTGLQRFAWFLYSFAIWDIIYYVALKIFLNWPESFLTWDILFLIPVTWLGPVLAPLLSSVLMILLANLFLYGERKKPLFLVTKREWTAITGGAFLIFLAYVWEYSSLIITNGFLPDFWSLADNETFIRMISEFVPGYFHWEIFISGILLVVLSMGLIWKRVNK